MIGPLEIVILIVILLLIFHKRLPGLGRSAGTQAKMGTEKARELYDANAPKAKELAEKASTKGGEVGFEGRRSHRPGRDRPQGRLRGSRGARHALRVQGLPRSAAEVRRTSPAATPAATPATPEIAAEAEGAPRPSPRRPRNRRHRDEGLSDVELDQDELQRDRTSSDEDAPVTTKFGRKHIDSTELGVSHFTYEAGIKAPFGHRHGEQEEAYVVIGGGGRMKLDDEIIELAERDLIRVAPEVMRAFEAGPDGLDLICIGGHKPEGGDGEKVDGFWD